MINAKNLEIKFGDLLLLQSSNFTIGNNKIIGLVGKNGCGKSTLFKVLVGLEQYSAGHIDIQNETIGYIPQEFSFPNIMLGEYLEKKLPNPWDSYKISLLADQLHFTNFDEYQLINTMSEGQKMKVKLMETLFTEPTILFIDEPTNHLDIEGIMWFENYIKHLGITIVMISHDRSFLNHTVDAIWEIDKQKIFEFVGDYDDYKTEKLRLIDKWNQEYVLFLKRKAQLETLLENVRKIKAGKQRGRAVRAAKSRIDREITQNQKEKYISKKIKDIDFATDAHEGKLMLRLEDLSKSYDHKLVFKDLNFEMRGKEKIWLFGPNGVGKTTLVKLIMGTEQPTSGSIKIGNNISVGYFSQVQTHLAYDNTIYEEFIAKTGCSYSDAYSLLKNFLFDKDAIQKKIKSLSPGERARFAFAIFAYKNYDMLILDEPDNHLDIETKEVLEKSLREYAGALLLISHDRYFVESIGVDRVLNLKEGALSYY